MDSAQPFDQFKELVQMLKPSAFAATKPQPSPHTNIPHQSILINTTAVSSHSVVDSQHTYCLFKHLYRLELHLIETTKLQKGQSFGQPSPGPRMLARLVTNVRFYSFWDSQPPKNGKHVLAMTRRSHPGSTEKHPTEVIGPSEALLARPKSMPPSLPLTAMVKTRRFSMVFFLSRKKKAHGITINKGFAV